MKMNVLLSVDLFDADDKQRADFDFQIAECQWAKVENGDNTYCTTVTGARSDQDVVQTAQADVSQSARAAQIAGWDGVCVLSDECDEFAT